ncbi:MAG TPA: CRTAC1 family protein [Vicinamibacterales bacterium]|nr:CRTAC1 family protein [Vicinamibacterales bacterium]
MPLRDVPVWLLLAAALLAWPQAGLPSFEPYQPDLIASATLVNAWADYDRDGDPDLFVGFNGQPNRLYRNDDGRLVEVAASAGVADARATRAAAWGDFDGDGDPDLLVGFAPGAGSVLRLYRNDAGRFVDVTVEAGLTRAAGAVRQPIWVDDDLDGDLDLFVAFRDGPNALYRNANGRFEDVAAALGLDDGRRSVGAVWFDEDGDGDLDLYVGNMDGDPNGLWINPARQVVGPGGAVTRFVDVAAERGLAWGGRAPGDPANGTVRPCVADVDNDGRLDLIMANYGPNGLFLNRRGGRWEDASVASGLAIDARDDTCAPADVDHDGRLDLFINGTVTGGRNYPDFLFRGVGSRFDDVTPPAIRDLEADHGVAWADVDGDGDLDLALTGAGRLPLVLRNGLTGAAAARSLMIRVESAPGVSVPGAEVRVFETGSNDVQTRWVDAGSGYNAQSDLPVHVGLRSDGPVRIDVRSPGTRQGAGISTLSVQPGEWRGRVLVVRVGAAGR